MMTSQSVRKARPEDLPELKAVLEQTWTQSNSEVLPDFTVERLIGENSIATLINKRLSDCWVAEGNNTLLGVLGATHEGYIWACYVRIDWQRQGIGSALMAAVEDHFRGRGLSELNLDIIDRNVAAQMFYRSRGWVENERRTVNLPGYKATSIRLSLNLIEPVSD